MKFSIQYEVGWQKASYGMFIHFLNDQILNLYEANTKYENDALSLHLRNAIVYSLVISRQELFIPIVDIVQSKPLYYLKEFLRDLAGNDLISFIGSSVDPDSILKEKAKHFSGTGIHSEWHQKDVGTTLDSYSRFFTRRTKSTTQEMKFLWRQAIEKMESPESSFPANLIKRAVGSTTDKNIIELQEIPERLLDKAFLWSVVEKAKILDATRYKHSKSAFEFSLAYIWISSYLDEYGYDIVGKIPNIGPVDCGLGNHPLVNLIDLQKVSRVLDWIGVKEPILRTSHTTELVQILTSLEFQIVKDSVIIPLYNDRYDPTIRKLLSKAKATQSNDCMSILKRIADCDVKMLSINSINRSDYRTIWTQGDSMALNSSERRIFIGHGRSKIWLELKDFLEGRLKLPWDEFNRVPVAGKAITNRLEEMLGDACFAFIILTAEDEHKDGTIHARENAIHEVGLFQGKLGFDKAIVLLEEGCEEFSNIHGLNQIRFPVGNIKAISEDIRVILEARL